MRSYLKRLFLATSLFAGSAVLAHADSFNAIYAFGDSLSDVGNAFIGSHGTIPGPPYSNGRFSNGPVWVQDLAASLNLPALTPSLKGGTDYAVGSAQSGTTPVHTANDTDLPAQVVA